MKKIDQVYMLVLKDSRLWYSPPDTSVFGAWQRAYDWERASGSGQETREAFVKRMYRDGWRAKKVTVQL